MLTRKEVNETMNKKVLLSGILFAVTGIGVGTKLLPTIPVDAATDTTATTAQSQPNGGQFDPSKGGHVGSNGFKEELLTGDTAAKVTAAAKTAVSGGTVDRVETNAEGAAYEAHMTKSDGSHVTVKLDKNFTVTSVEDGMR